MLIDITLSFTPNFKTQPWSNYKVFTKHKQINHPLFAYDRFQLSRLYTINVSFSHLFNVSLLVIKIIILLKMLKVLTIRNTKKYMIISVLCLQSTITLAMSPTQQPTSYPSSSPISCSISPRNESDNPITQCDATVTLINDPRGINNITSDNEWKLFQNQDNALLDWYAVHLFVSDI